MIESRYENFLGTDQVHHAMRNHVRRGPSVSKCWVHRERYIRIAPLSAQVPRGANSYASQVRGGAIFDAYIGALGSGWIKNFSICVI